MSRKPKKGYFVRGKFVAAGSELDLELQRELRGGIEPTKTKTELKAQSAQLQELGEALTSLRAEVRTKLNLPDKLEDAIAELNRITNFEGKRRQSQYVGKLMRRLDETEIAAIRDALNEQSQGSPTEAAAVHAAEVWRERLMADDEAVTTWLAEFPETDSQQLRSLVRQARKDRATDAAQKETNAQAMSTPEDQTKKKVSRAYKDLFQLVRAQMQAAATSDDIDGLEDLDE